MQQSYVSPYKEQTHVKFISYKQVEDMIFPICLPMTPHTLVGGVVNLDGAHLLFRRRRIQLLKEIQPLH